MELIEQQRCFHHASRSASVRCPGCARFFCVECVAEHHRRYLCSECIAAATEALPQKSGHGAMLRDFGTLLLALATIWFFLFVAGHVLLLAPDETHVERAARFFAVE